MGVGKKKLKKKKKMSGSETGVMTSREPFSVGLQKSPVTSSQPVIQNMRLAFSADGTAVYKPVAATSPSYQPSGTAVVETAAVAGGGGDGVPQGINVNMGSEPMKRKRGRPRKYGPDGSMALALTAAPSPLSATQSGGGFSPTPSTAAAAAPAPPAPPGGSASPTSLKKARGRPPGSSKKLQLQALGKTF